MKIPDFPTPHVAVERLAYWFYSIAAIGSSIGQIWAMAAASVWPDSIDIWVRVLAVAPFAIVIDLAGVVTSAFADTRRRLGEAAYGWRALSLFSVAVAVGINIFGHREAPQYATAFGFLGVLAYTIWLLHSDARRRDALRAQNKLADTAPVYGPWQWVTEFETTRLARQLARAQGLGLYDSLQAAREHIRIRHRNQAFAKRIESLIRAMHHDPIRAEIAVTGMNLNIIAEATANLIDNTAWATYIAQDLNPPAPPTPTAGYLPEHGGEMGEPMERNESKEDKVESVDALEQTEEYAKALQRVPVLQADYQRWRGLWAEMSTSGVTNRDLADAHGVNVRTLQHIRRAGSLGLLASSEPPTRSTPPVELLPHNGMTTMTFSPSDR